MTWLISQALMRDYESSHCSQEQEAESSVATCSDGELCVRLNLNHMPLLFCAPDKMTAFSRLSRFGMTFAPLTADRGEDLLTWCQRAFLVRTSRHAGKGKELTENAVGFTAKQSELLARFDLASSSWKTPQCSLLEGSDESCEIWEESGSMRSGGVYQRPPLERRTEGKESGFLPTPSGTSNHGKNHVVGRLDEWGGASNPWRGTEIGRTRSPSFEEWMMGWPVGWTVLTPYETDKFHEWQQQHSVSFASAQDGEQ